MLANIKDCECRNNECKTAAKINTEDCKEKTNHMIAHYERILSNWANADKTNVQLALKNSVVIPVIPNIEKTVYEDWKKTFEEKKYVVTFTDRLFTVSLE